MTGHYDPLPPDEVIRLDALDAQFRRMELKGWSFIFSWALTRTQQFAVCI
jgi:hypothetical protein